MVGRLAPDERGREGLSPRLTQVALLMAAFGAIMVMLRLLGTVAGLVGLVAIVLGGLLAAPAARGRDSGWWTLLAVGAVFATGGALLDLVSAAAGGLLTLIGGVAVLVGAAFGYPMGEASGSSS
ncbi:MAG: hypothetical protein H0V25_03960 [Solirubrobacterales bacterium]|nr:hypothetical protein [Solirubrobacterales bacterium]